VPAPMRCALFSATCGPSQRPQRFKIFHTLSIPSTKVTELTLPT
jgi:hypothetical protein